MGRRGYPLRQGLEAWSLVEMHPEGPWTWLLEAVIPDQLALYASGSRSSPTSRASLQSPTSALSSPCLPDPVVGSECCLCPQGCLSLSPTAILSSVLALSFIPV